MWKRRKKVSTKGKYTMEPCSVAVSESVNVVCMHATVCNCCLYCNWLFICAVSMLCSVLCSGMLQAAC